MNDDASSGYRLTRRTFLTGSALAMAAVAVGLPRLTKARQGVPFSGGGQVGGNAYQYQAAPEPVAYGDKFYIYATGKDGTGYYTTYDGSQWTPWQAWASQPVKYQGPPAAATYQNKTYVFYTGQDGHIYHNAYDGNAWSGWNDVSGPYTYQYPPYVNIYGDTVFLYGTSGNGTPYYRTYNGQAWSDWQGWSDAPSAKSTPYGVDWGGYNNVFYYGADGKVYWNRYNQQGWTGYKALLGDGSYQYCYAVGYAPEKKLYAYTISTDGVPYYNAFTEGQGWSGWSAYPYAPAVKVQYQPNAYVYGDAQHVVYTGTDGHAYYAEYQNGQWGNWQDLGPNYDYTSKQYAYKDQYYLTYTGQDGYVYARLYAGGGSQPAAGYPSPTPKSQPAVGYPTPTPTY